MKNKDKIVLFLKKNKNPTYIKLVNFILKKQYTKNKNKLLVSRKTKKNY